MSKSNPIWPLILAVFLLGACAAAYQPTPYWKIHEIAFLPLVPGATTKDDVRKQVGVPLLEMHFSRLNEDVWQYRYLEGTATVMLAFLSFDPNGVYKSAFHMLDPAFSGGMESGK
jgi:hypothetical protein